MVMTPPSPPHLSSIYLGHEPTAPYRASLPLILFLLLLLLLPPFLFLYRSLALTFFDYYGLD